MDANCNERLVALEAALKQLVDDLIDRATNARHIAALAAPASGVYQRGEAAALILAAQAIGKLLATKYD